MTEKQLRLKVVHMLRPLAAFPVENGVGDPGVPDVATSIGWIELKIAKTPKRHDTHVTPGMRPAQRIWHRKWRRAGGISWALTLVDGRHWLLHDGVWAAEYYDNVAIQTFYAMAIVKWHMNPTGSLMVRALREDLKTRANHTGEDSSVRGSRIRGIRKDRKMLIKSDFGTWGDSYDDRLIEQAALFSPMYVAQEVEVENLEDEDEDEDDDDDDDDDDMDDEDEDEDDDDDEDEVVAPPAGEN